jgi:hypothetical protein
VVGENVTYQDLGVQNLRKFKTFWLNWSATNFETKPASPPLNSPPIKPIYKNIYSNYGKYVSWSFSEFIWSLFE